MIFFNIFIIILFVVSMIFSGRDFFRKDDCFDKGGMWNVHAKQCISEELDVFIQKVVVSTDIPIQVPEETYYVFLNKTHVTKDGNYYKKGMIQIAPNKNIQYTVWVILNTSGIFFWGDISRNTTLYTFFAPFSVDNGGSGTFWYIGTFTLDVKNNMIVHKESLFLGDRVQNIKIYQEDGAVWVQFKNFLDTQNFESIPQQLVKKRISFDEIY